MPYPGLPITRDPGKEGFRILKKALSLHSRFDGPVIELSTIPYDKMCEIYKEAREIAQYWSSSKRELFGEDFSQTLQKIFSHK